MSLEQYKGDMAMCCRCSACKFVPMQKVKGAEFSYVCPSISRYNFHAYSGGGRVNIGTSMLKNGMNYTDKLLHVVYNCQMCGGCDISCKYAMDMEVLDRSMSSEIECVEDGTEQYGRFLLETFDLWWRERRKVRVRFFDNLAEALAGQKPGSCNLHETCDSYCVVEYNGDVYPCDFFVEKDWKLGNITLDSWPEISRRQRRYSFAAKKTLPRSECQLCEYLSLCHGGCPKLRHAPQRRFEDLDYFCPAYKMVFAKSLEPLRKEVQKLLAQARPPTQN